MVDYQRFLEAAEKATGREIRANPDQEHILCSGPSKSMKVVAGPGSGKTTIIVLYLLKLMFVDKILPEEIIATTFTVRASNELKSRILSWGIGIVKELLPKLNGIEDYEEMVRINRINFDRINIGTLDSLSETTLVEECRANQDPPIIIEDFIAKHFMINCWFNHDEIQKGIILELSNMKFDEFYIGVVDKPKVSGVIKCLMDFHNRMLENGIDPKKMLDDYPNIATILKDYNESLLKRKLLDFAMLEHRFLEFLSTNESDHFFEHIKVLMVDEYQDTNVLQERIYEQIVNKLSQKGGCFIAVGDDDQSIYRFRGSRVHLFTDVEKRFKKCGIEMETAFLSVNYRSSENIVSFCNNFITIDKDYQTVRVKDKPNMFVNRSNCDNFPIFGIFRNNVKDLAHDVAKLVHDFSFNGQYRFIDKENNEYILERSQEGGPGDVVLLMASTADTNYTGKKPRLSYYIKEELEQMNPPLVPFNPRGTRLCDNPDVYNFFGTLMWCIDPDYKIAQNFHLNQRARTTLEKWMSESQNFIEHAKPYEGVLLKDIVNAWSNGKPYPSSGKWMKNQVTVLDILYNLMPWFYRNHQNAESMVNIQAVLNAISSAAIIKGDELVIRFHENTHRPIQASIKEFYRLVIYPLLEDALGVDETLFFSVSADRRFNIMTIHQAKGLEYPITIVDVSSDFDGNYAAQRNKRFPDREDETSILERILSEYSEDIHTVRSGVDMQFDDLIRKYFVAFSRAQDVLILVGLSKSLDKGTCDKLKNIALGWSRDSHWIWNGMNVVKIMR